MNDIEYRDFCAAAALSGLIARLDEDDDSLRHHYHVLCLEAFRAAEEMVEVRQAHDTRASRG
jgi:hypothetical protein